MKRRAIPKTLCALGIAGALTFASASRADAALMLYATVGGLNFCAQDNLAVGVCAGGGTFLADLDPVVGNLDLGNNANVGGLQVTGSFHQQVIAGAGPDNILQSGSTAIINPLGGATPPGTINATVIVSATDFVGPASSVQTSGSGTFTSATGSTIQMNWYNDPLNRQGATGAGSNPGNLVDTFSFVAPDASESFSHNASGPLAIVDPGLFSMTVVFQLSLVDGGSLTSRGQNEIKPRDVVPEPASMVLLGIGLLGAGIARRRRQ